MSEKRFKFEGDRVETRYVQRTTFGVFNECGMTGCTISYDARVDLQN